MFLSMLVECRSLCWRCVVSAIWKTGVMDQSFSGLVLNEKDFIFGVSSNGGDGGGVVTRLYYGGGMFNHLFYLVILAKMNLDYKYAIIVCHLLKNSCPAIQPVLCLCW